MHLDVMIKGLTRFDLFSFVLMGQNFWFGPKTFGIYSCYSCFFVRHHIVSAFTPGVPAKHLDASLRQPFVEADLLVVEQPLRKLSQHG